MLIQPTTHMVAMEADTYADGDMVYTVDNAHWDSFVAEYSNKYKPLGMPAECATIHHQA